MSKHSDGQNGKGSKRRPREISRAQYDQNWLTTFGPEHEKNRRNRAELEQIEDLIPRLENNDER